MIKKSKSFKPYTGARATLQKTGSGVYLIKEGRQIVYVGYSGTDLKKTLYRHFQKWNDLRHPDRKRRERFERVTYFGQDRNKFNCIVYFCTPKEAEKLERFLIQKFKPRDNSLKLAFDKEEAFYKKLEAQEKAKKFPKLPDDFFLPTNYK